MSTEAQVTPDLKIVLDRAQKEVPAIDKPALSDEQQKELYRLNYKRQISTLSLGEEVLRQRLISIARGRK